MRIHAAGCMLPLASKNNSITKARPFVPGEFVKPGRYRTKTLPSAGAILSAEDVALKTNMTLEGFDAE